ncbi:TPA: hypothetical protein ACX3GK_004631 [Vibrio parahaemolyticus]|uniref:hypothetical protein n=1 Tax=Vibrio TaxID=662 RepID=UPI00018F3B49|nr:MULTISPECIES: hypothetical protein [Vibrio]EJG0923736.1 hypothetical protein [Vibrio parahaemolyticus O1:K68]EJG0933402.1 hypothetical protein [Vibrio parahaemolyticus O1]EJG0947510.1 hypothetical protein [Vibrio parahaemolyticus O10]EQM49613.1 hypothetical protein D051_4061 [Vibrio parahaemolyticus VPCR-2010]ALG52080.1 hypothetical protein FORC6_1754 [Vibrio parahaemolyticus]
MDIAFCTIDGKEWYADEFWALGEKAIVTMRRNLQCTSCKGDAWFRKSSYGNKVPHFCAHHSEDCTYATNYEVVDDGDGGDGQPAANPDSGIVLDLGLDKNYEVDVQTPAPKPDTPVGERRSGKEVKNGGGKDYPAHLTLKNTLYKLVRSDKLYTSDSKVTIPNAPIQGLPEKANELFVNFKDVHEGYNGLSRVYWGFISDAGFTADGRLWLNAGNRTDGLSVSINPDITEEFRAYFKVDKSLDQLEGCHALIIGDCYYATTGKPVIWCGSLDYVVLRRYNFDKVS